jgi:hypothetical protein
MAKVINFQEFLKEPSTSPAGSPASRGYITQETEPEKDTDDPKATRPKRPSIIITAKSCRIGEINLRKTI